MTVEVRNAFYCQPSSTPMDPESMTQQHLAESCDIHTIVKNAMKGHAVTHWAGTPPQYGDFTYADNLKDALDLVDDADEAFQALPSSVRALAGHTSEGFLRLLATESGARAVHEAGFDLGLPEPPPEPSPQPPSETVETTTP